MDSASQIVFQFYRNIWINKSALLFTRKEYRKETLDQNQTYTFVTNPPLARFTVANTSLATIEGVQTTAVALLFEKLIKTTGLNSASVEVSQSSVWSPICVLKEDTRGS